jgi:hypothetical protein
MARTKANTLWYEKQPRIQHGAIVVSSTTECRGKCGVPSVTTAIALFRGGARGR